MHACGLGYDTLGIWAKASGGNLQGTNKLLGVVLTLRYLTSYGITLGAPSYGIPGFTLDWSNTNGSYTYKSYIFLGTTSESFMNGDTVLLFTLSIMGGSGFGTFELRNDAYTSAMFADWFFEYDTVDCTNYATPFIPGMNPASPIALPVELTSFHASGRRGDVALHWQTASETNSLLFEVQRSYGRVEPFRSIGTVEAAGTTDKPRSYDFHDRGLPDGTYHYRLRQVDRDGKAEFSSTIAVRVEGGSGDCILPANYPNPFADETVVQFVLPAAARCSMDLYDAYGRLVRRLGDGEFPAGLHRAVIDGRHLRSGVYHFQLSADGRIFTRSITVAR